MSFQPVRLNPIGGVPYYTISAHSTGEASSPVPERIRPTTEEKRVSSPKKPGGGSGNGSDGTNYLYEMSSIVQISTINDIKEKKKAIYENAKSLAERTQVVVDFGYENLIAGKDPWHGLDPKKGITISPILLSLSGNVKKQQYYQNALANHLAKAIMLSLEQGAEIRFYFDIDGSFSDKTRRPHATRSAQPIPQIHLLNETIAALSETLGVKIHINTNRPPEDTKIFVKGNGLDPPGIEGVHHGAYSELGGHTAQRQLELSKRVSITALSSAYRHNNEEYTYISDQALLAADTYKLLGDTFTERYIKDQAEKHDMSVIERKRLNSFLLNTLRVNGKVYEQWLLRILELKEQVVGTATEGLTQEELTDRYRNFRDTLLNLLDKEDERRRELEGIRSQLKDEIVNLTAENYRNTNDSRIAELQKSLEKINKEIVPLIQLIGYGSNETYLTYTDSFGRVQKCYNLWKYLKHDPQDFMGEITEGELVAICEHIRSPRNISEPKTFDESIKILQETETLTAKDLGNGLSLRENIRYAHYLTAEKNNGVHPNKDIDKFVRKGWDLFTSRETIPNTDCEIGGVKAYLNWRLCKYLELHCTEKEILNSRILQYDKDKKELTIKNDFLIEHKDDRLDNYINTLKSELEKSNGTLKTLSSYVDSIYSLSFIDDYGNFQAGAGSIPVLNAEEFYPDWLHCVNSESKLTGMSSSIALISFEDKRKPLKPWAQGYNELLPNLLKSDSLPTVKESREKNIVVFYFGDSQSDLPAENRALHTFITDNNENKWWGAAIKIYNHISKDDFVQRAIKKYIRNVKEAQEGKYTGNFREDYKDIFALEEVYGDNQKVIGYRKVKDVEHGKVIHHDENIYSREEIEKEVWDFIKRRIYERENVAENVCGLAEAVGWISGENPHLNEEEFEKAKVAYKKDPTGQSLNIEEQPLIEKYEIELEELEKSKYISQTAPHDGVYFEYTDPTTEKKYYRMDSDRTLATKDGERFTGDEKSLRKRAIIFEVVNDKYGVAVYKDTFDINDQLRIPEHFDDPNFLYKNCRKEEGSLPSISPVKGLFANKLLLGIFGENGLKNLVTKLPNIFSSTLAVCGGLLSLGGIGRLASKYAGGSESTLYSTSYWTSQIFRAGSAFAGACRGLLNVNKYYSITIGEFINIFSALGLNNGLKHVGFACGNIFLLTGRGIQSAQRALTSNILTKEEIEKGAPVKGIIDPRPFQIDVTKFNTEKIMLPIKNAAPNWLGHFVGSAAGSVLTTFRMLKQTITNPKLIFQLKDRVSDKSGNPCTTIPSVGHLFTLSGVLSGIGGVAAATVGRAERFGEVAESGFNSIGRWANSFGTFIQSLPIIFNGLELAANQNGLPRMTRGLDGKTIHYSPERAGYGQVIAGGMFGLLSWLDLSKDWAAALLDAFAIGPYFGLPKMNMSASEEEKMNSLEQAENMLFESDKYFDKTPKEERVKPQASEPRYEIAA